MNYHILKTDVHLKSASVVFHFPVPIGNNTVGTIWADAFLIGVDPAPTSTLHGIDSAELTQIEAGQIIEHRATVRFSSVNLTNAQRLSEIVAKYTTIKEAFFVAKSIELNFTGKQGDV